MSRTTRIKIIWIEINTIVGYYIVVFYQLVNFFYYHQDDSDGFDHQDDKGSVVHQSVNGSDHQGDNDDDQCDDVKDGSDNNGDDDDDDNGDGGDDDCGIVRSPKKGAGLCCDDMNDLASGAILVGTENPSSDVGAADDDDLTNASSLVCLAMNKNVELISRQTVRLVKVYKNVLFQANYFCFVVKTKVYNLFKFYKFKSDIQFLTV